MTDAGRTTQLRVVEEPRRDAEHLVSFCGHCGRPPEAESRVCTRCGLGLILQARNDVAPGIADPFVVVDGSLLLCALSRRAERLLGLVESDAINRHINELIVPAEAESSGQRNLATLISWAARGDAPPASVIIRPANTFGIRYSARVGPCGPPQAALIVLADASA